MGDLTDPFSEGTPDFDDPELSAIAPLLSNGAETAKALTSMEDTESVLRAVLALDDSARLAALLVLSFHYASQNPNFQFRT